MKPIFAKISDDIHGLVFTTKFINLPNFTTDFHFHQECQLTCIVKSSGYKIVGDCIDNFEPGEVTFLGSDIPHVWYNQPAADMENEDLSQAHSVALFFDPDKLMQLLSAFYNTQKLEQALQFAKRGMKFHGSVKKQLKNLLLRLATKDDGAGRLILLLEILQLLYSTKEYTLLASAGYVNTYQTRDNERMDNVFKYLFNNFTEDIHLGTVAKIAHMNKEAFCRYFKSRTQKTVFEFVTEIRIAHAIKRLINGNNLSIATIAYECGYKNVSNFNRLFKRIAGETPSDYKKKLSQE